jgi:hypothetical protein
MTATLSAPPDVLFRAASELDVEVRTVSGKRELHGIVVPFGKAQRIDHTLVEQFARSALSAASSPRPHRVPLVLP